MSTELATTNDAELAPVTVPAQQSPALVYLSSLAESSRRPMRQSLDVIARLASNGKCDTLTMPWWALGYQHTQAIRSILAVRYSPVTANRHISALRGVLKEAWRLGYVGAEEYQRAVDVKPIKGQKAAQSEKGRHLKTGEFAAVLRACFDETCAGTRDAAIIALAYACGLRRAELAALQTEDYVAESQLLTVRRGKGNRERILPVAEGAADALADWLHVRGEAPGALFTSIRKGDHMTLAGLTDQAIYTICQDRAEQAGVKSFSPHDLRRTFAGDLLDAGADISTVQKLMGHANANTTAGYDRRDARAKRKAVGLLHIPYQRRFQE